jgi:hypothetical protein
MWIRNTGSKIPDPRAGPPERPSPAPAWSCAALSSRPPLFAPETSEITQGHSSVMWIRIRWIRT